MFSITPKSATAQEHWDKVKAILVEEGLIDSRNCIRRWKKTTWPKLLAAGHTSLNYEICRCMTGIVK